jgi:hypothetical protein
MIRLKFGILGKRWTLKLLTQKAYEKRHGADSVVITYSYKRTIDVQPTGVRKEIIVHELVHAYLGEMCTKSTTDLTGDDVEEICADLFAKRGRELLDLADIIFEQLVNSLTPPEKVPASFYNDEIPICHYSDKEGGKSPCGDNKTNSLITADYDKVTCEKCKVKIKKKLS